MSELQATLTELGLQEYHNCLVEHGFDTWINLCTIRETDMAVLGIKLGHRRRLQREIVRRQGHHDDVAEFGDQAAPSQTDESGSGTNDMTEEPHAKRRYIRKPPRDPNAPTRPDTAYVAYAKAQRQDPQVASLTFVEIAKLVGDRWAHLSNHIKDRWINNAEVKKAAHKSAVTEYQQTEAYQEHRKKVQSKPARSHGHTHGVSNGGSFSWTFPPKPESQISPSTADGRMSTSPTGSSKSKGTQQVGAELTQGCSTASASAEISPSPYDSFSDRPAPASNECDSDVTVIQSIWKMISQEQASESKYHSAQISYDDLLSYRFPHPSLSKSFYVQSLNPFNFQPRSLIGPILQSFLQKVNIVYYLIDPDELWGYLDLVLDSNSEVPTLTKSILCFCIAIGYQNSSAGPSDMAVIWYEHGRRFLDDRDWNMDPTVMRILALISMFHMAQRPSTSSHYLDAAIRIGEANSFHITMAEINEGGQSWNIEWLDMWNTMMDMNRILVLGSEANDSIIRTLPLSIDELVNGKSNFTTYKWAGGLGASRYRFIRTQSDMSTRAFGDLFDILGLIQQQLGQNNKKSPSWGTGVLMQKLEEWLQSLPNGLLLLPIAGSPHNDQRLLKNTMDNAPDTRRTELLHIYSLYFGTMNLLTCPSLQRIVTIDSDPSTSTCEEDEKKAYKCLNGAYQLISISMAFNSVSPFPIFAWLPQCILFASALICVLGILWQRQLLARGAASSRAWLDRSNHSLSDALHIFAYLGICNEQCQRHYVVLQLISVWLEGGTDAKPTDGSVPPTNVGIMS